MILHDLKYVLYKASVPFFSLCKHHGITEKIFAIQIFVCYIITSYRDTTVGVINGVYKLRKVDSTNLYAKKHIETLDDRTVILTKEQTAGRGRLNRSWIDLGKNNVFMSIVLKPSETYQEVYSNITQYLSVVLCHALEYYGLKPQIKWPNDVLVNGKKLREYYLNL